MKVKLLEKQIKKYSKKFGKKFNEGRITKSKKIIFDMHEIYTSKEFSYGKFQYLTKFILNRLYKRANKIIYVNEIQIDNLRIRKLPIN